MPESLQLPEIQCLPGPSDRFKSPPAASPLFPTSFSKVADRHRCFKHTLAAYTCPAPALEKWVQRFYPDGESSPPSGEKLSPQRGKAFHGRERLFPRRGKAFRGRDRLFPRQGKAFRGRGRLFPRQGKAFHGRERLSPRRGKSFHRTRMCQECLTTSSSSPPTPHRKSPVVPALRSFCGLCSAVHSDPPPQASAEHPNVSGVSHDFFLFPRPETPVVPAPRPLCRLCVCG
jgi:hypothetical protein